jgi:voltage-gated potassium channel Kch
MTDVNDQRLEATRTPPAQAVQRGQLVQRRRPPPPRARARRVGIRRRLRYRFDNSLAHGPLALIGWLGLLVLAIVLIGAIVAALLLEGGEDRGFLGDVWETMIRVLDSSAFEIEEAWPSRLVGLAVTLAGLFIGGSLIGLIATALDQRVSALSAGRSPVLESEHTLILGWSARLPVIVQELVVANESLSRPAIVILAPRPVAEMEAEIRERVGDTKRTRVVCRSGSPSAPADLELANLAGARSVIVLAEEGGDAAIVKAILAVKTLDPDFSRTNIVAEFSSPTHADTVRILTDGAVSTVNSDRVIAEVTAQACHQSGLAVVFRELLDFAGDECYFVEVPELVGHTYAEALLAFRDSSVIGCLTAAGVVELNPPPAYVFGAGDQIVVISEDDSTVSFGGFVDVPAPAPGDDGASGDGPVRVLIVGWSDFGPKIVVELNEFLPPGSQIEVCVDDALVGPSTVADIERDHPGVRVWFLGGRPEALLELANEERFDQVVVIGYRVGLTPDEADSRTLLALLTLRKIWPADSTPPVRILAQVLDQRNVELATATGVDDFIVSDALASLMLAQLSERAELQAVFDDLFDPNGAVIELRPAPQFVADDDLTYAQLVAAGITREVSVIGWRIQATGEVTLNPVKDRPVRLGHDDQVLVVGLRASAAARETR